MSMKNPRVLTRLFSNLSKLSKSANTKPTSNVDEIAQSQVQKAINLLKDSKFNFETITEEDKERYIKDFTQILSTGLYPKKPTINKATNVSQHFDQSILGLNQILTKVKSPISSRITMLDNASIHELIKKVKSEVELLRIYDDLVNNNNLNLSNFRLIIFNKHLHNLNHVLDKLNFVNNDGKYDGLKILVATRAYILKSFDIGKNLYKENIDKWLYLRSEGKLSYLLEKSLYQFIFKYNKGTTGFLLDELSYSLSSYILLVETIPRKFHELRMIQVSSSFQLSKNQDLLLNFISYIISKPISSQTNILLRKLIKLSVENQVHKEDRSEDSQLTIHKFRFINGVSELVEDLAQEHGASEPQLSNLIKSIHETDDLLQNETVLKFI